MNWEKTSAARQPYDQLSYIGLQAIGQRERRAALSCCRMLNDSAE